VVTVGNRTRPHLVIPNRRQAFPKLLDPIIKTSEATPSYNCIAWAAGDDQRWWEAAPLAQCYWPIPVSTDPIAVSTLIEAYEAVGFVVCNDVSLEFLWERVIIYAHGPHEYTHAARQLGDGRWTSKLGEGIDLTHRTPAELSGPAYGAPVQAMKRRLSLLSAVHRLVAGYLTRLRRSCGLSASLIFTFALVDFILRMTHCKFSSISRISRSC